MIRHGFDGGEELLKPVHLAQPVEGFPKTVLVTFQRKVVEALQKRLPVETEAYTGETPPDPAPARREE